MPLSEEQKTACKSAGRQHLSRIEMIESEAIDELEIKMFGYPDTEHREEVQQAFWEGM
jgi:hypothetical protein